MSTFNTGNLKSIEYYTETAQGMLSEKRFRHCIGTAQMCRELAVMHGCDPEKAYLTGILHDICKEKSGEELIKLASLTALEPLETTEPGLLHAPAGAVYIRDELQIDDKEIFTAVRFHSIGRAGMSDFEKVIYLGDLVERGRKYPDVDKYRGYALECLDKGMYMALKWAIEAHMKNELQISIYSCEAYNYFCKKVKG